MRRFESLAAGASALSLLLASCADVSMKEIRDTELSIEGNRFLINGDPTDLYGIRVASASQSDELAERLIANLDDYLQHGVNAIAVFFQGSSGGFSDPFSHDGTDIDPGHLSRMKRIIEACDQRGMVVVVGVFYQRAVNPNFDVVSLESAQAVRNAVRTATLALQGHRNIALNIANEQNSGLYRGFEHFDFNDPQAIIELCRIAKAADPKRLVGGGGYHDESNVEIGKSDAVDILLFDTFGKDVEENQYSGWHYDQYVANGVTGKPIVNVELYGGWTRVGMTKDGRAGFYRPEHKATHFQDVDAAAARPGLSVFFHSNPWCQGPADGLPVRYDLGGDGTENDLGIRWYFEYVRDTRQRQEGAD